MGLLTASPMPLSVKSFEGKKPAEEGFSQALKTGSSTGGYHRGSRSSGALLRIDLSGAGPEQYLGVILYSELNFKSETIQRWPSMIKKMKKKKDSIRCIIKFIKY